MRKIKVYANPNDWRAYLATPHHKILSSFAEDDSSKEPIYLLPDLSPDTGLPNGSIFTTNGFLYPYAVGRDIGCGYAYGILHKEKVNAESPHNIEKGLRQTGSVLDSNILRAIFFEDFSFTPPFVTTLHNQQQKGPVSKKIREYLYNAAVKQIGILRPGNHFIEIHRITSQTGDSNILQSVENDPLIFIVHNGSDTIGDILTGLVDVSFGVRDAEERDVLCSYPLDSKYGLMFAGVRSIAINFARYHRFLVAKKVSEIVQADLEFIGDNNHTDIFPTEKEVWHYSGVSQVEEPGKILFVGGSVGGKSRLVVSQKGVSKIRGISHGAGTEFYKTKETNNVMPGLYTNLKKSNLSRMSKKHRSVETSVEKMEEAGLVKSIAELVPLLIYKNTK